VPLKAVAVQENFHFHKIKMSSATKKCSICQKSLGKDDKREVTTSCNHTFHRDCANQRLIKSKSNDCPVCRKQSALHDALVGSTLTTNNQRDSARRKISKDVCLLFLMIIRDENTRVCPCFTVKLRFPCSVSSNSISQERISVKSFLR
jgi:hypothetical protein